MSENHTDLGLAMEKIVEKIQNDKYIALTKQAQEFLNQGFHTEDLTIWNWGGEWGVCPLSYFDENGNMKQILIPAYKEPKLVVSGKLT